MYAHICVVINSSAISTAEERSLEKAYQKLRDCDRKLKNTERLHSITSRWLLNSPEYLNFKRILESRNRTNWLLKLESLARERWFLLLLKAKYAGMVTDITVHTYYIIIIMFTFRWTGYSLPAVKKHCCYC